MRQSFKLFFRQPQKENDIRRLAVSVPPPSWDQFVTLLDQIYGNKFHPELTIQYVDDEDEFVTVNSQIEWQEALIVLQDQPIVKVYITEHPDRPYFKDSPPPQAQRFYEQIGTSNEQKSPALPAEVLHDLASSVPKVLQSFFKRGKILPHNIPEWIRDAVKIKHVGNNSDEVELDVDVDKLYKLLLDKAISFLNEGMYDNAKLLFQQLLALNGSNPLTLYNLACVESLKGELKDALEHLRLAVENGYSNLQHMLEDPDLNNLKFEPDFLALLNQLKTRFSMQNDQVLESPQVDEQAQEEQQVIESVQEDEQVQIQGQVEEDEDQLFDAESDSDSETDSSIGSDDEQQNEQPEVTHQPEVSEEAQNYAEQIQKLVDMGFSNIENNETLLIAADGDIESVIHTLLEGFVAL